MWRISVLLLLSSVHSHQPGQNSLTYHYKVKTTVKMMKVIPDTRPNALGLIPKCNTNSELPYLAQQAQNMSLTTTTTTKLFGINREDFGKSFMGTAHILSSSVNPTHTYYTDARVSVYIQHTDIHDNYDTHDYF